MAIIGGAAASLVNTPIKLRGSACTSCTPPFYTKKTCSGSACRVVNNTGKGSSKGSQKIENKDASAVMDRRQAIVLMMGTSWAMSAMAAPNPNDGTQKILQSAPLTFNVGRPARGVGEEVLTVSVRVARGEACGFNVFINLPGAQSDTPISSPHFAGTFFNEPNRLPRNPFRDTQFRIGITDIINELGLSNDPNLFVTIVPRPAVLRTPIVVKAVTLHLESL